MSERIREFSYSQRRETKGFSHVTLVVLFLIFEASCLPVEVDQPACYPEEGCPSGFECIEGHCVTPKERELLISAECISGLGCQESLLANQITEACLILEQPSGLQSTPLNYTQVISSEVAVAVPLLKAPLRASLVLLHDVEGEVEQGESQRSSLECLDTELLLLRGLNRECVFEQGCLLRLRSETISRERILEEEPLTLSFDATSGQCIESVWGFDTPRERCGGGDMDCDGFFDEGLFCIGGN